MVQNCGRCQAGAPQGHDECPRLQGEPRHPHQNHLRLCLCDLCRPAPGADQKQLHEEAGGHHPPGHSASENCWQVRLRKYANWKMNYLFSKFFEHDTSWAKTSRNGVQLNPTCSGWIRRWRRILTALMTFSLLLDSSPTMDLGRRIRFDNDNLLPYLFSLTFNIHPLPSLCCWGSIHDSSPPPTRNLWRRHFVTLKNDE